MPLFVLTILTLILCGINIYFGAVSFPASDVTAVILGNSDNEALEFIILESRLPQCVTALLSGGGLAACGLMLQTIFRNPLAGPSILGISSGSSLGVALIILLFGGSLSIGGTSLGGNIAVFVGALAGSMIVMVILLILSEKVKGTLTLLIVGMMTGYLASSIVTLLSSVSSAKGLQSFVSWGMGSFSGVSLSQLPLFSIVTGIGLVLSMLLAKPLNLLLLGDLYATSLGVSVKNVRRLLLLATGVLTAIITAACGPISFIGLAMPHIARLIVRTDDHLILIPATFLCGAVLALSVNVLSVLPEGYVIPINALTPLAGVPVVLHVLLRKNSST